MSIKITFRGITCEIATPREAAELMMVLDQLQAAQLRRVAALSQPTTPGELLAAAEATDLPTPGYDAKAALVTMLRLLVERGEEGADARALMEPLQTTKVKGVGGRLAVVNKELRRIGVEVADAYVRRHTKYGWAWFATEKTPKAIGLLNHGTGS